MVREQSESNRIELTQTLTPIIPVFSRETALEVTSSSSSNNNSNIHNHMISEVPKDDEDELEPERGVFRSLRDPYEDAEEEEAEDDDDYIPGQPKDEVYKGEGLLLYLSLVPLSLPPSCPSVSTSLYFSPLLSSSLSLTRIQPFQPIGEVEGTGILLY